MSATIGAETTGAAADIPPGGGVPTRLLVYGMAHADGSVNAEELFGVAQACGVSADQVRSCLRRMVTEGLFTRLGNGRSARYEATVAGHRAQATFRARTRLAFAQDRAGRGWDRHWHLVGFGIPESKRPARDALRERLVALGGAAVHNGLYLSPHPWEAEVTSLVEELGVVEFVLLVSTDELSVGGEGDPRALSARLWPLDLLADRYRAWIEAYQHVPAYLERRRSRRRHLSEEEFVAGALTTTIGFQGVFNDDPLLPPELLPRPWPGKAARDLFLRNRRLALQLRTTRERPALFRAYDELIESLA